MRTHFDQNARQECGLWPVVDPQATREWRRPAPAPAPAPAQYPWWVWALSAPVALVAAGAIIMAVIAIPIAILAM